jgi:hypothetical protein
MAQSPLLIIYLNKTQHNAFLHQHMVQVAGWLRLILQPEQKTTYTKLSRDFFFYYGRRLKNDAKLPCSNLPVVYSLL